MWVSYLNVLKFNLRKQASFFLFVKKKNFPNDEIILLLYLNFCFIYTNNIWYTSGILWKALKYLRTSFCFRVGYEFLIKRWFANTTPPYYGRKTYRGRKILSSILSKTIQLRRITFRKHPECFARLS